MNLYQIGAILTFLVGVLSKDFARKPNQNTPRKETNMTTTFTSGLWKESDLYKFVQNTEVNARYDSSLNSTYLYENAKYNYSNGTTESSSNNALKSHMEYKVQVFIYKYYLFLLVGLGIPGNVAALITLSSMRPLSSTLLYMAVLATVDTISLIVKLMYQQLTAPGAQLGNVGCKLAYFLGSFFMIFASWILVAMSVERFIAIWFPLRVSKWCTKRRAVIVLINAAILLIGLNMHFFWSFKDVSHEGVHICGPNPQYAYFVSNVLYYLDGAVYSIAPCVILFICNFMIVIGIRRSNRTHRVLTNEADKSQSAEKLKQQNQIITMLVTISIAFFILTMPNCIFYILQAKWNYKETSYVLTTNLLLGQIVHCLSDSNHAVNFYLYFLSGQKFRQKFISIICCRKSLCRIRFNTTISELNSVYPNSLLLHPRTGITDHSLSQTSLNYISLSPHHVTSKTSF